MLGVEIVKDHESKTPAGPERDRIVELAFQRGMLFLGAGPNSIRIAPPLVVTRQQADEALDVLEECVEAMGGKAHKSTGPGKPQGA